MRRLRNVLAFGSLALALAGSTTVFATVLAAGTPVQSPDLPLAGRSAACQQLVDQQTALGSVNFPDAEVEPHIAVDPTNSRHLVASFQQDRWNDGGSNGLTVVTSTNAGQTWQLASSQPRFSICAGATAGQPGFFGRATDPWVSFSSDGKVVYAISDSFNADGPAFGGASSIIISRSIDGGATWQTPVTAQLDTSTTVLNDKETVTGDPLLATTAYAVWDRLVSPSTNANPTAFNHSPAFRGPALFSKTTDAGVSWSPGRIIFDPGEQNQTIGNQIVVPNMGPARGTLVDGFTLILNSGGFGNPRQTDSVGVIRSANGGATWSQPIIVSPMQVAHVTINGHAVRTSDELAEFAADPTNGALYAVWQDGRFSPTGKSKIALSLSTDGGVHWSTPIRVDQSPGDTPAFTPQVHVASDGTVGVLYYDFENATAAQPGLTDAFIVHCHAATNNCALASSWASGGETRLSTSGSFDMTTAPSAGGFFLGDYDGLTTSGTSFVPFFMMSRPIATRGRTDPFSNTAH
jgi:hypothetical protein